ncbi:hypothetical protein BAUCODRAFT_33398 [Baudoinia panamericana UAMH 10762]|uniref:Eukaryotic translation initiation factor 3 subunit F n=1 Tax=Baudoinia panamericana (strain UAMH 10762) TaxID=717646 RepID=M2N158_BAUPA|nr:uncharacterized protein BAUCODRAFT_33398 [Baudoinia panamericana UAMH 10762]EMC97673.1 hypothetical protein BAUCODRAFT_33398 [Baudoinia panamericana UAMH 10762]
MRLGSPSSSNKRTISSHHKILAHLQLIFTHHYYTTTTPSPPGAQTPPTQRREDMGTPFIHLARPLAPAPVSTTSHNALTAPISISLQPQALLSILDHASRRPAAQPRVIGTLLGTRSEDGSEVEIRDCYAVPHTETTEQVEVDMDYQKRMLELHLRASPKEVLVGWYASTLELDTFSALIQNFYGQQGEGTWPYPAVHLTVSTEPGQEVETRAYISSAIGTTLERAGDSCLFIPVPCSVRQGSEAERAGLSLIASAKERTDRTVPVSTDLETLEAAIEQVLEFLERVANYVSDVLDEEKPPSTALGQYLLNMLSLAPKVELEEIERSFNEHVQDVLLVGYLANTIRTQIDLSNRLATAAITMGGGGAAGGEGGGGGGGAAGGDREQKGGERGQRRDRDRDGNQQRTGQAGPGGRRGEQ